MQAKEFGAPKTAAEQQGEDGPIPFAGKGVCVRRVDQIVGLVFGQPVPCPNSQLLHAGHAFDRGRGRQLE